MSILQEFPFPLGKPEAQELVRVMIAFYSERTEALRVTQPHGIDPYRLKPDLSPMDLWEILCTNLAKTGELRAFVQETRDRHPKSPSAAFLDELLNCQRARVSPEPRLGLTFDDSIKNEEALLFFDDLTLDTGKVPALIASLNRLIALAPAICLLRIESPVGSFYGTGCRIGEKLVMTNHHVLFGRGHPATKVHADFGFELDAAGGGGHVASLEGAIATMKGEKDDDWAVIEVEGMQAAWPILALTGAPAPQCGDLAYIIQHPAGQHKRLGYVRNTISDIDDRVVRYLTDTRPGSSGAPVFDAQGRLIALHHAGGRPITVPGKPPLTKNEGVRISRVFARMRACGLVV